MSLITSQQTFIGWENHAPTHLELAGIAVREQTTVSDIQLSFASPLVQSFTTRHYDAWRFGNLSGSVGDWSKAFEQYSRVDPRVASFDERPEVRATVGALCSSLYSESTKYPNHEDGIAAIKRLLINGCRIVLGFKEISFWIHDAWRNDGWQHVPPDEFMPGDEQLDVIKTLLPTPVVEDWQFTSPWNRYAVATILPTYREGQYIAVVVSELEAQAAISRERRRLLTHLLSHFAEACTRANADYGIQRRLRVRDRHVKIMNSTAPPLSFD